MANEQVLAAEFTQGSKRADPRLDINLISGGRRTPVASYGVANKREARTIAARNGATPWNF